MVHSVSPATEDERIAFGARRPDHPRRAPPDSSVDGWIRYTQDRNVKRVCCLLDETILPFLDASKAASERVVVHCSAGSGRTGHVLALWRAHDRGCSVEDAVAKVRRTGRQPPEAASRADLRALL